MPDRRPLRDRLLSGLLVDPSGCLILTGTLDRKGYGAISVNGIPRRVHRVMWELFEGPIPDGLDLDHVRDRGCTNRNCASIAHLEPVTHRVNLLRGDTIPAMYAAREECSQGHPFDLANTYRRPEGSRVCRTCKRARNRRYKERRRAAA